MKLLRRTLLKGFLAGGAVVAAAPGFSSRSFAAAAQRPHAVRDVAVVALVAGSPLDAAFLDQARRLTPDLQIERIDGPPLGRRERFEYAIGRGRRVLALLPDADAVLFRETVRHAGGSLLADERAAPGLVSFVAHL